MRQHVLEPAMFGLDCATARPQTICLVINHALAPEHAPARPQRPIPRGNYPCLWHPQQPASIIRMLTHHHNAAACIRLVQSQPLGVKNPLAIGQSMELSPQTP